MSVGGGPLGESKFLHLFTIAFDKNPVLDEGHSQWSWPSESLSSRFNFSKNITQTYSYWSMLIEMIRFYFVTASIFSMLNCSFVSSPMTLVFRRGLQKKTTIELISSPITLFLILSPISHHVPGGRNENVMQPNEFVQFFAKRRILCVQWRASAAESLIPKTLGLKSGNPQKMDIHGGLVRWKHLIYEFGILGHAHFDHMQRYIEPSQWLFQLFSHYHALWTQTLQVVNYT